MDSNKNEAQWFLPSVPNPPSVALFSSRHAPHPPHPANFAGVGDSFNNCAVRPTTCKRKLSSTPSPLSNERLSEAISNGSPVQNECRLSVSNEASQLSSASKRQCLNNHAQHEVTAAPDPTSEGVGPPKPTDRNADDQKQDITEFNNFPLPNSTLPQNANAQDTDRPNTGKLDDVIEHVLKLARSDEPHEDVFVLPTRTREFIPMPSPRNPGSTPSSSLNTSPPVSPASSPRLISPAFSNQTLPQNSVFIATHTFARCAPVDQIQGVIQLPQRALGGNPPLQAATSDAQRDRFRLQANAENPNQVTATVAMLMKTTHAGEPFDTSFMQPKAVVPSGFLDASGAALQQTNYGSRQLVSKVPVAVCETKLATGVPVQPDPIKQTLLHQHQQLPQNAHIQPRLLACFPPRQIFDSVNNPVFSVPSAVQPGQNISNQVAFPHGSSISNGVTQVIPNSKQAIMTPIHTVQYADLPAKPGTPAVAPRKRPPSSSKRKKPSAGQPPSLQSSKMAVPVSPMPLVRHAVSPHPAGIEFNPQHHAPPRQAVAIQDILNRLRFSDAKTFLSDPVMEAFSSALPPSASPQSSASAFSVVDESWLRHCGSKYQRSGLSLKAALPTGNNAQNLPDNYLSQRLPQLIVKPTMQTSNAAAKSSKTLSRICPSPKPVTLENRMQSLFTSLRQPALLSENKLVLQQGDTAASSSLMNSDCSLLQMLKTPCLPRECPPDRKSPPLPLYHIPNTNLLKAPPPRKSFGVSSPNPLIDSETGEAVGAHQLYEESRTRVVFSINTTQLPDLPKLLQFLCERHGINRGCVSYVATASGCEVLLNIKAAQSSNALKEFEVQLRSYFPTMSARIDPGISSENLETNGEVTSQMKLLAELRKEKPEDSNAQPTSPVKHKEELISISSIQGVKKSSEEHCRNCNTAVQPISAVRRKMDEIAGASAPFLTVDHGCHGTDVFVFCGNECINKFASFLSTWLSPPGASQLNNSSATIESATSADPRQHHQLVFGGISGTNPILVQHLPPKSLKLQTLCRKNSSIPVAKKKGSPKLKRFRDFRWRTYKPDFHHARKFAPTLQAPTESESQRAELCRTAIRNKSIPDARICILCNERGDGNSSGTERLLCLGLDQWIHLNCSIWCYDIYESVCGSLHRVDECIQRALTTSCAHCMRNGAGLPCYNPRCNLVYHVPCAISIGCMFFTDRGMYCPSHQPRDPHPMQLPSLNVSRKVYLTRNEYVQVARVIQDETRAYRIRVGSVVLHSVGQLLPHQIQNNHFHTQKYIYPVHFCTSRLYWSMRRPGQRALYRCEILEHDGAPLFQVASADKGYPDLVRQNRDCTKLWRGILETIKELRREHQLIQTFPNQLRGEDMFGLSEPHIVRAIESLPGVDSLVNYAFHFGRLQLITGMPLAVNPSGCARSEPNLRTYLQRKRAFVGQSPSKPSFRHLTPFGHHGISGASDFKNWSRMPNFLDASGVKNSSLTSWTHQYRRLKSESLCNVVFGRSRIQGFGLFAAQDLEPNTIVIEYVGELIRTELANKREKEYEARNRGLYMFRLEDDLVIDATMSGGPARYINHSCQPNCFTKYVNFDNEGHIVIITKRKIEKGEELTYDYQFDLEERTSKIPCLCGAVGCRKWMN